MTLAILASLWSATYLPRSGRMEVYRSIVSLLLSRAYTRNSCRSSTVQYMSQEDSKVQFCPVVTGAVQYNTVHYVQESRGQYWVHCSTVQYISVVLGTVQYRSQGDITVQYGCRGWSTVQYRAQGDNTLQYSTDVRDIHWIMNIRFVIFLAQVNPFNTVTLIWERSFYVLVALYVPCTRSSRLAYLCSAGPYSLPWT